VSAGLAALALAATLAAEHEPAALVGGQPITLAAVDTRCGAPCATLTADIAARKWAMLETLIGEALLARRPAPTLPAVTEAEIERYIAEHPADFHGPPERDRAAVRFFLERERRRAADAQRIESERAAHPPTVRVERTDPALAEETGERVLAEASGRTIHDHDVEARLALPLYRLRGERARERRRHLDALVGEALWATEARRRGTSPEALRAEARGAAAPVTDADIDRYFEAEIRAKDPAAAKRPDRIRPYLEFRTAQEAEAGTLATLRTRTPVAIMLAEPVPPRLVLGPGPGGWKGPPEAPIRIVFLTGYRERSRRMWPVARSLGEEPDVALTVRALLPLWDPEATAVAAAARCATAEGRFWPFHDAAADREPLPDGAELSRIAAAVGLAAPAFASCTSAPATLAAVAGESAEAEHLGLDEPPALLIDGVVFGGVQGADQMRDAVRRARDKKGPRQVFGR
jgi:hypothetical protein